MAGARDGRGRFTGGGQARAVGDQLREELATITKALVLGITDRLRRNPAAGGTPVATGHARANWVPAVGAPSRAITPGTTPSAHDLGVAEVLAFELGQGAVYTSNNVPYIRGLNRGRSPQAASGFIEAAIDAQIAELQAAYAGRIDLTRARGAFQGFAGAAAAENLAAAYNPLGGDW